MAFINQTKREDVGICSGHEIRGLHSRSDRGEGIIKKQIDAGIGIVFCTTL